MLKIFDPKKFLLFFILSAYFFLFVWSYSGNFEEQHFGYLSLSFLEGKLDLNNYPQVWDDTALYSGNHYWPLGPFPAVLLLPITFVVKNLGYMVYERNVQWVLVLTVLYLIFKIAKKLKYSEAISVIWALSFCMGSVFISTLIMPYSWYFSHTITVLLIFMAFYEYLGKRRYFLIGSIYGAVYLTRASAFLGIVFYLLSLFFIEDLSIWRRRKKLFQLLVPAVFSFLVMGTYNILRFGNFFDQGYSYQLLSETLIKAKSYGLFGFIHLPGNLYYLLFASPVPVLRDGVSKVLKFPYITYDLWGLGMFYTSPYFLKLFILPYKDKLTKFLLTTSFLTAIPILFYYGIGVKQYGYRYSLDFLPYLLMILIIAHKNSGVSRRFIFLMFFSILFNLYMILQIVF